MSKPKAQQTNNWVEEVKLLYENGGSDAEAMAIMRLTPKEFHDKLDDSADFKKFIEIGRLMSRAWWMRQGRINLADKGFNTPLWVFNVKNRFGWSEKVENVNGENPQEQTLSAEQLQQAIKAKMANIVKNLKGTNMSDADILSVLSGKTN